MMGLNKNIGGKIPEKNENIGLNKRIGGLFVENQ